MSSDEGAAWQFTGWKENIQAPTPAIREAWVTPSFSVEWGENPQHMAVSPTDSRALLATDLGRVMKSTGGGVTWTALYSTPIEGGGFLSTGLDDTTCYGVHVDPFQPERIFVTYTDIGLWRSENGGQSWRLSIDGLPREWKNTAYALLFDPAVKGRVWAAFSSVHDLRRQKMARTSLGAGARGGIARSLDGGVTWSPLSHNGLPNTPSTDILLDPASAPAQRVLYANVWGKGVFKSSDNGDSWTRASEGLPENLRVWRLSMAANGALYVVIARATRPPSLTWHDEDVTLPGPPLPPDVQWPQSPINLSALQLPDFDVRLLWNEVAKKFDLELRRTQ